MKKLLSMILSVTFVFGCLAGAAAAEEPDLANMDFESLVTLKRAVDAEVNSRPEAEKFELYPGNYTVGVDIKAGRYYAILNHTAELYESARFSVYKTRKEYDERPSGKMGEMIYDKSICYKDAPTSISLAEGNYIYLSGDSVTLKATEFTDDDYYKYAVPEGTPVPRGIYKVGENGDIPAGTYDIYTATEKMLTAGYYVNREKYEAKENAFYSRVNSGEKQTLRLEEGYVFIIDGGDAIMKKAAKLIFD